MTKEEAWEWSMAFFYDNFFEGKLPSYFYNAIFLSDVASFEEYQGVEINGLIFGWENRDGSYSIEINDSYIHAWLQEYIDTRDPEFRKAAEEIREELKKSYEDLLLGKGEGANDVVDDMFNKVEAKDLGRDHRKHGLTKSQMISWQKEMFFDSVKPKDVFSVFIGGHCGSSYKVEKIGNGIRYTAWESEKFGSAPEVKENIIVEVSPTKWKNFLKKCKELGVDRWDVEYRDDSILDGTRWGVTICIDKFFASSSGLNAYPGNKKGECCYSVTFVKFLSAIRRLIGNLPFN